MEVFKWLTWECKVGPGLSPLLGPLMRLVVDYFDIVSNNALEKRTISLGVPLAVMAVISSQKQPLTKGLR